MSSASPGARHDLHDVPDVRSHNTPSDQYVRDGRRTGSKDVKLSVYALTVCLKVRGQSIINIITYLH